MQLLTQKDLDEKLAGVRTTAVINARFLRPFAGGQPAGDKGLAAFVQHHLGIDPESLEFEKAIARIRKDEIGERETTPEGGEVATSDVYQVNVIRQTELGSYISEHQIKALLKQAASRLGIFSAKGKVGSKGDLAEMGTIRACGESLQSEERPWEIYLRSGDRPASTEFVVLNGSVSTPMGKKSIQHHTEVSQEGAEFCFSVSWPEKKLTKDDIAMVIAAATQIGLGSCLSLGFGRFEVVSMEIQD